MPYRLVIEPSVANVPSLEVFGRIYDEGEAGMEFDSPHLPTNAENMRSYSYHYKTILIASSPSFSQKEKDVFKMQLEKM